MRTLCGLSYDRSTSAYTSKRKPRQCGPSFPDDRKDHSAPASVLSRVAERLDHNNEEKHRHHLTEDRGKPSKQEQGNPSATPDIYIKLSDCQAACRLSETVPLNADLTAYSIDAGLRSMRNPIGDTHPIRMRSVRIEQEKQNCPSVIDAFLRRSMHYRNTATRETSTCMNVTHMR